MANCRRYIVCTCMYIEILNNENDYMEQTNNSILHYTLKHKTKNKLQTIYTTGSLKWKFTMLYKCHIQWGSTMISC